MYIVDNSYHIESNTSVSCFLFNFWWFNALYSLLRTNSARNNWFCTSQGIMQCSRVSLRGLHAPKRDNMRGVFKQTARKSTVAKTSSSASGIRPTLTAEQAKEAEQIARQLVDATVARQKNHTRKAWEKASLDEKRKIMDKDIRQLSYPNKLKSQERLDFEAIQPDADYTAVTPTVTTIDDSNRPKPGAFVELRRLV